jgi:hypothetical protein
MTNSELAARIRERCAALRAKPIPLADLIPLLQQAADVLDRKPATAQEIQMMWVAAPTPHSLYSAFELGVRAAEARHDQG